MSLTKLLKNEKNISTDLGIFSFVEHIGEGGNSEVFLFKRELPRDVLEDGFKNKVAIKFLKADVSDSQLPRFKDEFFCVQQIGTHENIAKYYHFDKINVADESYYIIIMKYYESSLNKFISTLDEDEKNQWLKVLFSSLCDGLKFLHDNNIIHRDIKPQNILFDTDINKFVITDMGIAKFPETLMRESQTDKSDRLANFSFSPKEQLDSKVKPLPNYDIYSLGQVLHWFITGRTVGGTNRQKISSNDSIQMVKDIDEVIEKCVDDNPNNRFQSISNIKEFLKNLHEKSQKPKDIWEVIHDFDGIVRKNFTTISDIAVTEDQNKISNFFEDFNQISPERFWLMELKGGDNPAKPIIRISEGKYLLWGYIEIEVEKLIVYRNVNQIYKSFFIIITKPNQPFEYTDIKTNSVETSNCTYDCELGNFWLEKSIYIKNDLVKNGYFELANGEVVEAYSDTFPERVRYYIPYAYMIAPLGTPLSIGDREPSEKLMEKALTNLTLDISDVRNYENLTRGKFSEDIKNWL